jgi:hypothetical protein
VPGYPGLVAATRLDPASVVICSAIDGRILAEIPLPGRPTSFTSRP